MRIVSGFARGRRLIAPEGLDVRPTADRVREAVFNSLQSMGVVEEATVVDLFSGTGAMGLEAWSRGAGRVILVDRDARALEAIRANVAHLGAGDECEVFASGVEVWLSRSEHVDLALIDPPYGYDRWWEVLRRLRADVAVCEAAEPVEPPPGWSVQRHRAYGRTHITICTSAAAAQGEHPKGARRSAMEEELK